MQSLRFRTLRRGAMALAWLLVTASAAASDKVVAAATAVEMRLGARVGLAVFDTASGRQWLHRADERFPMVSTFKTLACASLLDGGQAEQRLLVRASDVLSYAPVTRTLVGHEVAAAELCAITLRTSDNTAANLVLERLGGPRAVTDFVRRIGDTTTRLDRLEPDLNEGAPGDPRDTTTPRAMAHTMQALLLGQALAPADRDQLKQWLRANEVGGPLLRAGLPASWAVADRSGAGGFGTRAVAAVVWPPGRAPAVVAIYLTGTDASMDARNAAIADIARALHEAMVD
ncbi:class A beta-lactamase [Ottowia testudinis]|uniref:Beta-lactamase n=1 Tax=Ottowia testudinis TaxID=2816950 RepID=A0A975CJG1_9BURK|nr:class A beta-lactamase [Ottowia testudinis]QTD47305.1 class A beta-lactamase [Ottowia testudinis]